MGLLNLRVYVCVCERARGGKREVRGENEREGETQKELGGERVEFANYARSL